MNNRLEYIKILIVEDCEKDAEHIKQGLLKIGSDLDKIKKENVFLCLVENKSLSDIHEEIKKEIVSKDIDTLFMDLHLINAVSDGIEIINNLMEDKNIFQFIPKYIITSDGDAEKNRSYSKTFHYAHFIEKPNITVKKPEDLDEAYQEKFFDMQVEDTLKTFVPMYQEIKKSIQIKTVLKNLEIILGDIKEDTTNIKDKVSLIENMNQTILKFFPLTVTEKQSKKLQMAIQTDMSRYMDEELEEFFSKEDDKSNFLKVVSQEFDKLLKSDLKKGAWNTFKDSIKAIAKSQDISDDNAALCALKLSYRGYSEISSFLKGDTEI